MNAQWPRRPMAEVAPLVRRPVHIDVGATYREIGIRSFAKGIFHKAPTTGLNIGEKRVFAIKPGDLLFNIVFAWEGAVAVASTAEDGTIGSHRFLTCVPDQQLADPRFLFWWFSRGEGREQLLRASPGGAGRNRTLGVDKLAAIEIPLPSLKEQRRIVQRIAAIESRVTQVRSIYVAVGSEVSALLRSYLFADPDLPAVPMRELVKLRPLDTDVRSTETYHFAGVYSFGRGVFAGVRKTGAEFAYKRLTRLRAANFVYPKLMAWEGALGIVPPDCDGLFVSPEFPVFEVNEGKITPQVLDIYFKTPSVWPKLSGASIGTNVRRRRLNPKEFLEYRMPLPSRDKQARLQQISLHLEQVQILRRGSAASLDAIMPAVLDKAFRGEL